MLGTALEPDLYILGQRSVDIGGHFDFACHGSKPSRAGRHGALSAFVLHDDDPDTLSVERAQVRKTDGFARNHGVKPQSVSHAATNTTRRAVSAAAKRARAVLTSVTGWCVLAPQQLLK